MASEDSALIFRLRRKRARITAERFDSTSLREDPVSLWICSAVANICTSGRGMRRAICSAASPSGTPTFWFS